MKKQNNTLLIFFLVFLVFFVSQAFAETTGRVTLLAQIDACNSNQDMKISVIDLATKEVIQREEVSTDFFSSLSINSRYLVYFKKEGHPAMRMIVDTNTDVIANYSVNFSLNLKNLTSNMETGISISVGTLKFDNSKANFILQPSESSNFSRVEITTSRIDNDIAKF